MAIKNLQPVVYHVLMCEGGTCLKGGSEEVIAALRDEVAVQGLDASVHTTKTRCNGRCDDGPIVIVYPQGVWYKKLTPELARRLVVEHLRDGAALEELVLHRMDSVPSEIDGVAGKCGDRGL